MRRVTVPGASSVLALGGDFCSPLAGFRAALKCVLPDDEGKLIEIERKKMTAGPVEFSLQVFCGPLTELCRNQLINSSAEFF